MEEAGPSFNISELFFFSYSSASHVLGILVNYSCIVLSTYLYRSLASRTAHFLEEKSSYFAYHESPLIARTAGRDCCIVLLVWQMRLRGLGFCLAVSLSCCYLLIESRLACARIAGRDGWTGSVSRLNAPLVIAACHSFRF